MYKKISIKSLLMRKIYSEEEENEALKQEKVLSDSSVTNDLEKEVLELNKTFDLIRFFHGDSEVETGVWLITPKQSLCVEGKLAEKDDHGYNFQLLYDAVYDCKVNIIPISNDMNSWQSIVMDDGNIAIQLTNIGEVYVWAPSVIDEFQLRKLQELNEQLKRIDSLIYDYNYDYLKHLSVYVHGWVRMKDGKEISMELDDNNLDYMLNMYHYDSIMGEAEFINSSEKERLGEKK